jgi:hypothetical protein
MGICSGSVVIWANFNRVQSCISSFKMVDLKPDFYTKMADKRPQPLDTHGIAVF